MRQCEALGPSLWTGTHQQTPSRIVDTFIHRAGRTAVRLFVLLDLSLLHDDEDISWTRVSDLIWGSSQICRYFKKQSHYISICFFYVTRAFHCLLIICSFLTARYRGEGCRDQYLIGCTSWRKRASKDMWGSARHWVQVFEQVHINRRLQELWIRLSTVLVGQR